MRCLKTNVDLNKLRYFKTVTKRDIIEAIAKITDAVIDTPGELDYKEFNYLECDFRINFKILTFTRLNESLNLKEALEYIHHTAKRINKTRRDNQLEMLYIATLVNKTIFTILEDYMFLKNEDIAYLEEHIVDVDTITCLIDSMTRGGGTFDLEDDNEPTKEVLKATLDELGIKYEIKDNKFYT